MKLPNLSAAVLAIMGLALNSFAADYADWVAKGYRWSLVSGPYAYITKENAKNEGSRFARRSVNETIGRAYYLRPGPISARRPRYGSGKWTASFHSLSSLI